MRPNSTTRIVIAITVALLLAVAACSDDSGPVTGDQQVTGDLFPTDAMPSPYDGAPDRYIPAGDGSPPPPSDGGGADSYVPPATKCGGTATVVLQEISTGYPDYLSLKNTGGSAVSLANFKLVMDGINVESYTFQAGASVGPGSVLYVNEYSSNGQAGDVNTGDNIPFYDNLQSNSVALYDASGNLLDFVAIGDKIVSQPPGATVTLFSWPANHNPDTHSIQRVAQTGKCPDFKASDWAAKAITRPPTSP